MAKSSGSNVNARVAGQLLNVLSDVYVLGVKTHGYHWNVTGPEFTQLHELFSKQYTALFAAADEVAERIRALDIAAPGSMADFLHHTSVKEATSVLSATAMLKDLVKGHENTKLRVEEAREVAEKLGDKGSEDLMIKQLQFHDTTLWMLRSLLA